MSESTDHSEGERMELPPGEAFLFLFDPAAPGVDPGAALAGDAAFRAAVLAVAADLVRKARRGGHPAGIAAVDALAEALRREASRIEEDSSDQEIREAEYGAAFGRLAGGARAAARWLGLLSLSASSNDALAEAAELYARVGDRAAEAERGAGEAGFLALADLASECAELLGLAAARLEDALPRRNAAPSGSE